MNTATDPLDAFDFGNIEPCAVGAEAPHPVRAPDVLLNVGTNQDTAHTADPLQGKLPHTGPSPHSGHALTSFSQCPRKYAYKHVLGVVDANVIEEDVSADRVALVKGTLLHQALALHYLRQQCEQRGEDPGKWAEPHEGVGRFAAQRGAGWLEFVPLVLKALDGYRREYRSENWTIMGVEEVFSFAPLYGVEHTRAIDLRVVSGGQHTLLDHKSTGRFYRGLVEDYYALDDQFLDLTILADSLWGPRLPEGTRLADGKLPRNGGVWVNVVEWPKDGRKPVFHREEAPAAPWAKAERRAEVQAQAEERSWLLARTKSGALSGWHWPKRVGWTACKRCAGRDFCRFGPG